MHFEQKKSILIMLAERVRFVFRLIFPLRRPLSPIVKILEQRGYFLSNKKKESIDAKGAPIPWYTYSAIDFLKQFSFDGKRVFEYGSGFSTLWWAKHAAQVVSVEQKLEWYQKIKSNLPQNVEYYLCENQKNFVHCIKDFFDVIVIDASNRDLCAQEAIKHISEDGVIILDDSQRIQSIPEYQRAMVTLQADPRFIQIDFAGLSPIVGVTKITTFFVTRKFNFKRNSVLSPCYTIGNIENEQ